LLIFARSLIPLVSPPEASLPQQPNKRVQCAPRQCRASLQTAPRVPSPHPIMDAPQRRRAVQSSDRSETRCRGNGAAAPEAPL